jgi:tetratricopeptide (TPR) repeat protein
MSLGVVALLLGSDADVGTWAGEALATPDTRGAAAEPDLRTAVEAMHAVTSAMAQASQPAEQPAGTGPQPPPRAGPLPGPPGLAERLDALDIGRYPLAALVRVAYATFGKDTERTRVYIDQALASPDPWITAATQLVSAAIAENEGRLDDMRAASARALEEFRALGERWGLSGALRSLGTALMIDGDLDGAAAAFTEARRALAELGSRDDEIFLQVRLAEVAARRGDLAAARRLYDTSRAGAEAGGPVTFQGIPAAFGAMFEVALGRVEAARPLCAAAERWLERIGPAHPVGQHMAAIVAAAGAAIALADADLPLAAQRSAAAYQASAATGDMPLLAQVAVTLADCARAAGQPGRAARMLGAAAVVRGADDPTDLLVHRLRTRLLDALGQPEYDAAYAAGKALGRAEAIADLDPARIAAP